MVNVGQCEYTFTYSVERFQFLSGFRSLKKKGRPFFFFLVFNIPLSLLLCLIVLGTDVLDEGRGYANENLNVSVGHVEGVEFVRLFDEQLL